ncbi:hypothetical protein EHS25_001767 [Saitozyma podzolica]|uniref:Major facilitator superfamily (MFS) profile domain-containing protein n=1 Tax=Saitozyma podzolica TaxID=1890683 RepID=A0A427YF32_9TREE|nr:hypothetical protein EHS25_001767 [Saitozyma podzolica]
MATPMLDVSPSEKPRVEHFESKARDDVVYEGLHKSRWDELSIPRTLWVFKRAVLLGAGGSIITNAGFIKQFGDQTSGGVRALNPTWVSTWSAVLNVGQIVTFTHISWQVSVADRYGRKASFYLARLWLVVGCALLNTAKTPAVWALAKLCNGTGIGVLQYVPCCTRSPRLTAQNYLPGLRDGDLPNRIRGGMVTFQAAWHNIRAIIVSVMMQQLNEKHPDNYLLAMRILWAPIGFMLLCWAFIPESPWFHARRDNKDAAMKSLKQLFGGVEGYDCEEEYGIITRTIEHENEMLSNQPSYRDVFKGLNLRRTLTVMILAVCQQLAGLSIISTYSTYFFSLAGLSDPFLGTVILSCVNLLAIALWSLTTDKLGRHLIVNVLETFVVLICFIVATTGNAAAGTGLLVICCFWTFAFQPIGMSYYLYSAELPSAILRIKTGPVTFFTNSITGIATCYATPPMLLALGVRSGFVYGALSVPMCILMWLYIPETKGPSASVEQQMHDIVHGGERQPEA